MSEDDSEAAEGYHVDGCGTFSSDGSSHLEFECFIAMSTFDRNVLYPF